MSGWSRYLAALERSWRALCTPERGGRVVRSEAFLAASSPHPVLNNGVLLHPEALDELCDLYAGHGAFAVWTASDDAAAEGAVRDAGFRRDVTTTAMLCDSASLPARVDDSDVDGGVDGDVAPAVVAELSGVAAAVLDGVAHLRCFATSCGRSGLALQEVADDLVMSFVATRPAVRGRGLATRVVTAALADARQRDAAGVALQATPSAERMYRRLGFRAVGSWQEWTPPAVSSSGSSA